MATKWLDAASPGAIAEAANLIREGKLVAYPTDTLYGLGAHAFQPAAIARVFEAKGRPQDRPLPLLLSSTAQMPLLARDIPIAAWRLAASFWPGALTIVLKKAEQVPAIVSAGAQTVALRVPNHPVTLALIEAVGAPIAGTSANVSGRPPAVTAGEVLLQMEGRIDAVLDGGRCPGGVESSVLDLAGRRPRLLRAGAIPRGELEDVLEMAVET